MAAAGGAAAGDLGAGGEWDVLRGAGAADAKSRAAAAAAAISHLGAGAAGYGERDERDPDGRAGFDPDSSLDPAAGGVRCCVHDRLPAAVRYDFERGVGIFRLSADSAAWDS